MGHDHSPKEKLFSAYATDIDNNAAFRNKVRAVHAAQELEISRQGLIRIQDRQRQGDLIGKDIDSGSSSSRGKLARHVSPSTVVDGCGVGVGEDIDERSFIRPLVGCDARKVAAEEAFAACAPGDRGPEEAKPGS